MLSAIGENGFNIILILAKIGEDIRSINMNQPHVVAKLTSELCNKGEIFMLAF